MGWHRAGGMARVCTVGPGAGESRMLNICRNVSLEVCHKWKWRRVSTLGRIVVNSRSREAESKRLDPELGGGAGGKGSLRLRLSLSLSLENSVFTSPLPARMSG